MALLFFICMESTKLKWGHDRKILSKRGMIEIVNVFGFKWKITEYRSLDENIPRFKKKETDEEKE